MKKQVVLLMLVIFALVGCSYFTDTDIQYEMESFDKAACISVDRGLSVSRAVKALDDPFFLDDKNVDAFMLNADEEKVVTTTVTTKIVNGITAASDTTTVAFATIINSFDAAGVDTEIELYLNKTDSVVNSLLSDKTYDEVKITDNIEAQINATFSTVNSSGADSVFVIKDNFTNKEFYQEAVRCLYGKTGSVPVFEAGERRLSITCEAVEVMSLYSYLDVTAEDEYTFYFDEHMSMRIWDEDGNRIPMKDNGIDWTMAAEFGDRADNGSGKVLAKCQYDLPEGRYFVRWIRAESTKQSAQFASSEESTSNYFVFSLGIFYASYAEDAETAEIADKLFSPVLTKELKSCHQCDTSLWAFDESLVITQLLRDGAKMTALDSGLVTVGKEDMNKGIKFTFEEGLPQGLFYLDLTDMEDVDTLRIYLDKGSLTMFKFVKDFPKTGGKQFQAVTANVTGITFKEMFVSDDIDKVMYMYNFDENMYLMSVPGLYAGEDVNMVFVK
ncbi:MAG: hypothetical protein WCT23_00470 [Candidatus Neomarinimicrobiota bacterium]